MQFYYGLFRGWPVVRLIALLAGGLPMLSEALLDKMTDVISRKVLPLLQEKHREQRRYIAYGRLTSHLHAWQALRIGRNTSIRP